MVHTRRMASMVLEDLDTSTPSDQNHLGSPGAQLEPRSSTPTPPFPLPHTTPTTPRSHKKAGQKRLQGITELPYDVNRVKETVKSCLKLDFEIEDWQAHTIYRLLQGYDGISIAGTSYGKSIIFEGLAAMSKKKVILVVCPLKVLEKDQAAQAREKGIAAIYINEDNAKDPQVWRDVAAGVYALVYVSPEMVLSPRFRSLLLDASFRERLLVLAVDEVHLVKDWGDDFRIKFKELHRLRAYTGVDIAFFSCTATASTETFEIIWNDLGYGRRPFWGVDVGIERPNLRYVVRKVVNSSTPILDVLNLLPQEISEETSPEDIQKALVFQKTRDDCRQAAGILRRCLPEKLRDCVEDFHAGLSEGRKDDLWSDFRAGKIRILVSTVAASIGCNDRDVGIVVNAHLPESLAGVSQRWGRGGRSSTIDALCLQLAPSWAFRPPIQSLNPTLARVQGVSAAPPTERKTDTVRRAKLEPALEGFINVGASGIGDKNNCAHAYMRDHFRPDTGLDTYDSLDLTNRIKRGDRSLDPSFPFASYWVVLDKKEPPGRDKCCHVCNPSIERLLEPCDVNDPRLAKYKHEFLQFYIDRRYDGLPRGDRALPPAIDELVRPSSAQSIASDVSTSSTAVKQTHGRTTKAQKDRLAEMLVSWRKQVASETGSDFVTSRTILPDGHIKTLMAKSYQFLAADNRTALHVRSLISWDLASLDHYKGILEVIEDWHSEVRQCESPSKSQAHRKKAKSTHAPEPEFSSGASDIDEPLAAEAKRNNDPFLTFAPSYRERAVLADKTKLLADLANSNRPVAAVSPQPIDASPSNSKTPSQVLESLQLGTALDTSSFYAGSSRAKHAQGLPPSPVKTRPVSNARNAVPASPIPPALPSPVQHLATPVSHFQPPRSPFPIPQPSPLNTTHPTIAPYHMYPPMTPLAAHPPTSSWPTPPPMSPTLTYAARSPAPPPFAYPQPVPLAYGSPHPYPYAVHPLAPPMASLQGSPTPTPYGFIVAPRPHWPATPSQLSQTHIP